jgi:hypothetical protein
MYLAEIKNNLKISQAKATMARGNGIGFAI